MQTTITVQSSKSKINSRHDGKYLISYHLAEPLTFTEQHYARLWYVGGTGNRPLLVLADFVQGQNLNGKLVPLLGCSLAILGANWVPLASNTIPTFGFLQAFPSDTTNVPELKNLTFIIEIAPASRINGTQSAA